MEKDQTVIISDLRKFEPHSAISETLQKYTWRALEYETDEFSGCMLIAWQDSDVPELSYKPGLIGWYAIYLGLWQGTEEGYSQINIRLSGDKARIQVCPDEANLAPTEIEEVLWKYSDMTDQDVKISHPEGGSPTTSCIAYLKFVLLSKKEIEQIQKDRERKDTRRLVATHDIHGLFYYKNPHTIDDFLDEIEPYRYSDVEKLHLEYWGGGDGKDYPRQNGLFYGKDKIIFPRDGDRCLAESMMRIKSKGINYYKEMTQYAQSMGIKVYLSLRMNAFAADAPWDTIFVTEFYKDKPHLRCRYKDGSEIERMSYAFKEVQDCVIDMFKIMADYGCEGISMLYNRCFPYVMYEEVVVKAFMDKTGTDPRNIDENDKEWLLFKATFLTDFMRRVRVELDEYCKNTGRCKLAISVLTLANEKQNVFAALDVESWIKEGLVDDVIAYPMALIKSNKLSSSQTNIVPIDIDYYKRITDGSDCKLYIEILPRRMKPETYRQRAMEIYNKGINGICLWDTYSRHLLLRQWTMASRLGHKDELASWDDGCGIYFRNIPVKRLGSYRVDIFPPHWGL